MKNIFFIFLLAFTTLVGSYQELLHGHWWGHYQSALNHQDQAQSWFLDSLAVHNSLLTHKGYLEYLYGQEKYAEVINYIEKNNKALVKKDTEIKKMYALSLLHVGQIAKADSIFCVLSFEGLLDIETCFYAVQSYMRSGDLTSACALIDQCINLHSQKQGLYLIYFLKSQLCVQTQELESAIEYIKKALQLRPDFQKGWLLLGMLAQEKGQASEAIIALQQYLKLEKTLDKAVYEGIVAAIAHNAFALELSQKKMGKVHSLKMAQNLFDQALYEKAIASAEKILSINPDNINAICLKIESLLELGLYDQMTDLILERIVKNPDGAAWYKVLNHAVNMGQCDIEKIAHSLQGICLSLQYPLLAWQMLRDIYSKQEQFEKAEAFLIKAIAAKHASEQKPFLLSLADIYQMQKKYDQMAISLETVIARWPEETDAFEQLLTYYIKIEQNIDKALCCAESWRACDAQSVRALDWHGFVLYKQEQYKEAERLFAHAAVQAPDDALLLLHQAKLARKQGEYEKVQQLCLKIKLLTTDYDKAVEALLLKIAPLPPSK